MASRDNARDSWRAIRPMQKQVGIGLLRQILREPMVRGHVAEPLIEAMRVNAMPIAGQDDLVAIGLHSQPFGMFHQLTTEASAAMPRVDHYILYHRVWTTA